MKISSTPIFEGPLNVCISRLLSINDIHMGTRFLKVWFSRSTKTSFGSMQMDALVNERDIITHQKEGLHWIDIRWHFNEGYSYSAKQFCSSYGGNCRLTKSKIGESRSAKLIIGDDSPSTFGRGANKTGARCKFAVGYNEVKFRPRIRNIMRRSSSR